LLQLVSENKTLKRKMVVAKNCSIPNAYI